MFSDETIAIGEFVRRQTPESQYSYFEGSENELLQLIRDNWSKKKPGYRDGVVLVRVPTKGFHSSVVKIEEDVPLEVNYKERREGEEKHIGVIARGDKTPAGHVEIVLYRADVLEEGNERETSADWEVISINASPWRDDLPMRPITMARNLLEKEGGTKGEYTAEQFAESIWFWSQHATVVPEEEQ